MCGHPQEAFIGLCSLQDPFCILARPLVCFPHGYTRRCHDEVTSFFCCFTFALLLALTREPTEDRHHRSILESSLAANPNINPTTPERTISFFAAKIGSCFTAATLVPRNVLCRYRYVGTRVKPDVPGSRFYASSCWNAHRMFFWAWRFWLTHHLVPGTLSGASTTRSMASSPNT